MPVYVWMKRQCAQIAHCFFYIEFLWKDYGKHGTLIYHIAY